MRKPIEPTLLQDLAQALSRAERSVHRQLGAALAAEGCTIQQWRILVRLGDGRGHPMSELAEFALVPAPSLTRLIDRMVSDGLVHRRPDARDRRRVRVHLTRGGWALYRRLGERIAHEEDAMLAGSDATAARQLVDMLDGLVDWLG